MIKKILTLAILSLIVVFIFILKNTISHNTIQPLFDQIEGVTFKDHKGIKTFQTQYLKCSISHDYTQKRLIVNMRGDGCDSLDVSLKLNLALFKRAKSLVDFKQIKEVKFPSLKHLALLSLYKESIMNRKITRKDDFISLVGELNMLKPYLEQLKKFRLPYNLSSSGALILEKTQNNKIIFYDTQYFIIK